MIRYAAAGVALLALTPSVYAQASSRETLEAMAARHAAANGLPVSLVHRVIMRESRYNPRLVGRGGTMGLMQIKHATARGMGYTGSVAGLLDPEVNMTYAVKYLAGAYRVANGNADRAVAYYASGYYYAAKRRGRAATTLAQSPAPAAMPDTAPEAPPVNSAAHSPIVVGTQPMMDAVD